MKKVGIIIGTRPEAIKLISVYEAIKKEESLDPEIICTGQHIELVDDILEEFNASAHHKLDVMTEGQTLSSLSEKLHSKLSRLFKTHHFDLIIVQGDTSSGMVAALEAFYHKIPVAHVEAGLRTSNKYSPFPEEINRRIISQIADIHFPPTETNKSNLKSEKIDGLVEVTGNTVIDSLLLMKSSFQGGADAFEKKHKASLAFDMQVLITTHRRENFGEGLENIVSAIKTLAETHPHIAFVIPVHPNPNVKLVVHQLSHLKNVILHEPFSYGELIFMMSRSYMILTDSGGIQEEAPSLNKPVLVLREETERLEMIDANCGILVGNDTSKIIENFNRLLKDKKHYNSMASGDNPYGDGQASLRISQTVRRFLNA